MYFYFIYSQALTSAVPMAQEAMRAPTVVPPLSATFTQPLPEYATKELAEQAFFGLLKETVSILCTYKKKKKVYIN